MNWLTIKGWLTEREGLALRELARDADVLELGAYCGRSTVCLASVAREVVTVDTFDAEDGGTFLEFLANVNAAGVRNVTFLVSDVGSLDFNPFAGRFDLVFVDTFHDAGAVERDTAVALRCVKPGGVVAWHDYGDPNWPDVAAVLGRLGLVPDAVVDRLAWRKIA